MNARNTIPPYEYLKGEDFIEMLKEKLNCRSHQELSELLDVPKSTFSTWSKFDRTSHELMVRLHLALNIPISELALEPKERKSSVLAAIEPRRIYASSVPDEPNPQHQTVVVQSFCLSNGELIATGELLYPVRRMNSFRLDAKSIIEVETNDALYWVDTNENDPVSGSYLISIDDRHSLNHIQRLPGKKLAVSFGNNTLEIGEGDIKVLGRLAVELKKF